MNKKQLIEALEYISDDEEIYISQPTGDYWRNIKLVSINLVKLVKTSRSAYCDSLIVDEENGSREVFVLS